MNVKLLPLLCLLLLSSLAKGQVDAFQYSTCDSTLRSAIKKFISSDFAEVIRLADSAAQCFAVDDLHNGRIAALNIKVRALYQMHELDSAMALVNRILAESDTLVVFSYVRMGTYFQLGAITYDDGDYEGALPHLLTALVHLEDSEKYISKQVGIAEQQDQNVRLVKSLAKITYEVFILSKGYLYNYLGLCYQQLADHDQAIAYFKMADRAFKEALKEMHLLNLFMQKMEAKMYEQICNYHIGLSYALLEEYELSNQHVQQAIDSLGQFMLLRRYAIMGRFYESLGDNNWLTKAPVGTIVKDYKRALHIYQLAAPPTFSAGGLTKEEAIAGALTKLAVAHFPAHKDSSMYYLEQSLRLFEDLEEKGIRYYLPNKAQLLMRLAGLYKKHGEPTAALELYRDALMILNEGFQPTNLFENPKAGGAIFEQHLIKAYRDKGAILRALADSENNPLFLEYALETYDRAIHILDEMRKNFTRGSLSLIMKESALTDLEFLSDQIYEEAVEVAYTLSEQAGPKAAAYRYKVFEISEKSKAFALRSAIFRLETFQAMPSALLERERALKNELFLYERQWKKASRDGQEQQASEFQNRVNYAKQKLEQFVDSLKANPATRPYYDLQYSDQIYSIADIQQNLLSDTSAIIEYLPGQQKLYGMLITKNDFHLFTRPLPEELDKAVYRLRDYLQSPNLLNPDTGEVFLKLAFDFHELLIAPARELLPDTVNCLKIVPHGTLHHLNFDFLIKKRPEALDKNRPVNFGTYPFLLEDYECSYYNSVSILMDRQQRERRSSQRASLRFAGVSPDYKNTTYSVLTDELAYAACRLPADEVKLLYGPEAGERGLRTLLQNHAPQILHLNAHASIHKSDPMLSYVVLNSSTDSIMDNFLQVAELYSLDMDVDLVVLSACDSGYGKQFRNGEGVISLARGCQYAGAEQVLMSLWPIDSEATAILMEAFYDGLLDKKLPPAAALHHAKQSYLKQVEGLERRSPFYWAGLVLLGGE